MAKDSVQVTTKGWMPEATKIAIPASNFAVGNQGRKAAVLHIVQGSVGSALSEFRGEGKQKSAHFVISNAGLIHQCVSVIDTAFANGLSWKAGHWIDPEGNVVVPPWQGLTPPINPNFQTISIEREGYYQEQPSAAENAAVVRVLRFLHDTFPSSFPSWSFMGTLIGHCHIAPKHRANCPGPNVPYVALATAANTPVSLPPTPPTAKQYRVRGIPIYQRTDLVGTVAGWLETGAVVEIDRTYGNGAGHLRDERGFVDMDGLE